MKKLISLFLAILLILAFLTIATTESSMVQVQNNTSIRTGAGYGEGKIKLAQTGEKYEYVGEQSGWYEIRVDAQTTGFLPKDSCKLTGSAGKTTAPASQGKPTQGGTYPDGTKTYRVWAESTGEYDLRLDELSIYLSQADFQLYKKAEGSIYASIDFLTLDPDMPRTVTEYTLRVFWLGNQDAGDEQFQTIEKAICGETSYRLKMWNKPEDWMDQFYLEQLDETTETTIAGQPCRRVYAKICWSNENGIIGSMGYIYIYLFDDKGYLITIQNNNSYLPDATFSPDGEFNPDEVLSSILTFN